MSNFQRDPRTLDLKQQQLKNLTKNEIIINEGEVKEVENGKTLCYLNIDSSLSVTACLKDGSKIGTHLVQLPPENKKNCTECLQEMKKQMGEREIDKLLIIGSFEPPWNSINFLLPTAQGKYAHEEDSGVVKVGLAVFFNCENTYAWHIDKIDIKIENLRLSEKGLEGVNAFSKYEGEKVFGSPSRVFGTFLRFEDVHKKISF